MSGPPPRPGSTDAGLVTGWPAGLYLFRAAQAHRRHWSGWVRRGAVLRHHDPERVDLQ